MVEDNPTRLRVTGGVRKGLSVLWGEEWGRSFTTY